MLYSSVDSVIRVSPSQCQVIFHRHEFLLDAQLAVYWQAQDTLIVSDLHLGKGSFLAHSAVPLPIHDMQDTLLRLEQLIQRYKPQKLIALGDSFHDKKAASRMENHDWCQLNALIARVPHWLWVLGNHDPALDNRIKGESCPHVILDNILLTHEPLDTTEPQIIGHFHPKMRHNLTRRHKITGKCFIMGEQHLLMPAFGSYTGGLSHDHQVMARLFDKQKTQYFLVYQQCVYAIS